MSDPIQKRRMLLYSYGNNRNGTLVNSTDYTFTTLAHERDLADRFAQGYNLRQGEGHVTVCDDKGCTLNKLELMP